MGSVQYFGIRWQFETTYHALKPACLPEPGKQMSGCVHAGTEIADNAESMKSLPVRCQRRNSSSWMMEIEDQLEKMLKYAPRCWEQQ